MSRLLIRGWIYVLPLPLALAMYYVWAAWSGNRVFALFVLLLPVFYGYVVPGIATNILHKWRFRGPWVVGHYYIHHGFLYAANMSPLLMLSFLGTSHTGLSSGPVLRILLCTGALNGFVYWIHDILMVRHGLVEIYNRPAAEGRSPEEIVTHYAPLCFFLIGLTYAAAALLAFQIFVIHSQTDLSSIIWVSLVGMGLMVSAPTLVYRMLESKS
jgi:hypothetical protein